MQKIDETKYKNELMTKLYTIWEDKTIPLVYRQWVRQVAIYIMRKEENESTGSNENRA